MLNLERIIHSSGDLSMQSYLRFSSNSCEGAIDALKKGAIILTDTFMAEAAVSPVAKRTLNSKVKCILEMAPKVIDSSSITRSSIGMQKMWLDIEKNEESKSRKKEHLKLLAIAICKLKWSKIFLKWLAVNH